MNSVPSKARRAPRNSNPNSAGSRQNKKTTKATQPLSRSQKRPSPNNRPRRQVALLNDFSTIRNGGLARMKEVLTKLTTFLTADPTRQASPRIIAFLKRAQHHYDLAVRASIGMPGFTDCVTTQTEGPKDIPTVPLSGYQLIKRVCYVPKSATNGNTGGGFYATLLPTDLAPFVGTPVSFFRISKITSWTVPRTDGNVNQGTFAGVSVPAGDQSQGTETMPIWSENWTPVGQGFASIVTRYPLGDFPQLQDTATTVICNHYTSLGGTGGITGIPVIFHVEIETLI